MPKGAKVIPYLRTENLKNYILSRGTYLYSPYMGVPPPPPPGVMCDGQAFKPGRGGVGVGIQEHKRNKAPKQSKVLEYKLPAYCQVQATMTIYALYTL